MGQPQRQEQHYEALYGNGEPGHSKANAHRQDVLRLEELLYDPIEFELSDFSAQAH
ncbi:MAG TPA: hypothetical protein VEA35_01790 [Ramlibacter sp.]|nr:hypothetical protein [Ramlibacter sp.]